MRSFVQEVLRRSWTSGSVLQTTLCYVEKTVPLVQFSMDLSCLPTMWHCLVVLRKPFAIAQNTRQLISSQNHIRAKTACWHVKLAPPRPPFHFSLYLFYVLIEASKFMQDKCYSNCTSAKLLSGLRRCERVLGEALEWRLWVRTLPAVHLSLGTPSLSVKVRVT